MPDRNMLAQLFLAGRSPEEQAARLARQHQASGLGGSAGLGGGPARAPSLDMTQPGPWGAGKDPTTTSAVPTPRPSQFSLPQQAPIPTPSPGTFPPDLAVSPQMPPDPMAASAPTSATLPYVPGSTNFPPDLGVSPMMPPDPMAASAPTSATLPYVPGSANLPPELAPSPVRPRDPMAASAPTEIGGYEAKRQFGLPKQKSKPKPKSSRAEQTKSAQKKFKDRLPQNAQPRQS